MTTDIYPSTDYTNICEHNLYRTWGGIKTRCYNSRNGEFKRYGRNRNHDVLGMDKRFESILDVDRHKLTESDLKVIVSIESILGVTTNPEISDGHQQKNSKIISETQKVRGRS